MSFDIDASTGQLLTKDPLDYEAKTGYSVIVAVSDGKNTNGRPDNEKDNFITVAITVTNEDEAGTVALSEWEPEVGLPFTAALADPDGGVSGVRWVWERSADQTAWTAMGGAASPSYTPVDADKGSYLRVTASYADGHGRGKNAAGTSTAAVPSNAAPQFHIADLDTAGGGTAQPTGAGTARPTGARTARWREAWWRTRAPVRP